MYMGLIAMFYSLVRGRRAVSKMEHAGGLVRLLDCLIEGFGACRVNLKGSTAIVGCTVRHDPTSRCSSRKS